MVDQNQNYDQQEKAAKQALAQPPITPTEETKLASDTTKQRGQQDNTSKPFLRFEKIQLWMNGCGIIVGAVVCVIYGFQLHVMKLQLAEMQSGSSDTHTLAVAADTQSKQAIEQTKKMEASLTRTDKLIVEASKQAMATNDLAREAKRSADATRDAVGIAKQSLDLSERSIEIQERPWVGTTTVNVDISPSENGKPMIGTITFTNTGKSPAFDVEMSSGCTYDIQPLINRSFVIAATLSKGILMPGNSKSTLDWNCNLPLTPQQYALVRQGVKRIYVFGNITYRDAIGVSGHSHTTQFCTVYLRATNSFSDCPEYNSAN